MDDITVTVKYDRDAPIDGSVDAPDGLSRINFSKHWLKYYIPHQMKNALQHHWKGGGVMVNHQLSR